METKPSNQSFVDTGKGHDFVISLVALWLFISGFLCLLFVLLFIANVVFAIPRLAFSQLFSSWPSVLLVGSTLASVGALVFLSFILFRIRTSLRRLERNGYLAALTHFLVILIGGLIAAPVLWYFQSHQQFYVELIGLVLNAVVLTLLVPRRRFFTVTASSRLLSATVIAEALLVLSILLQLSATFWVQSYQRERMITAGRNLKRQLKPIPPIVGWETYVNDEYKFSMQIPSGWQRQVYKRGDDSTIVDFAPQGLDPDFYSDVTTYFHITIFPVTDKEGYRSFMFDRSRIGEDSSHQSAKLGGVDGVGYIGGVGSLRWIEIKVEHGGYVYHLTLDDVEGTEIPNQVLSSFQFLAAPAGVNRVGHGEDQPQPVEPIPSPLPSPVPVPIIEETTQSEYILDVEDGYNHLLWYPRDWYRRQLPAVPGVSYSLMYSPVQSFDYGVVVRVFDEALTIEMAQRRVEYSASDTGVRITNSKVKEVIFTSHREFLVDVTYTDGHRSREILIPRGTQTYGVVCNGPLSFFERYCPKILSTFDFLPGGFRNTAGNIGE